MADYPNTPVVSVIKLPSGNDYYIKDADARDAIDELEQRIAGGMGFKIVWTQTDWASTTAPTSAKLATIPAGITVHYNSGASTATGTLAASADTLGNFYLTYSNTQVGSGDYFNEYATISNNTTYTWEKIGDTQVDLSGVVTDVSLTKQTATVIGSDATATVTLPTISSSLLGALTTYNGGIWTINPDSVTDKQNDLTSGATGKTTGTLDTSDSGTTSVVTGLGTPSKSTVLTGVQVTSQPTVALTGNATTATGRVKYVEDVTGGSATPTTTWLDGSLTDSTISASGDNVTVLTSLGTAEKSAAVSGISTSKLTTTTVTGVSSSTTTASKATEGTAQQTATGAWTAVTASSTDANSNGNPDVNENLLANISVSNEILSIGAAELTTVQVPQYTFADVTVPIKNSSATTVATGSIGASSTGATIATGSSGTIQAVTGYTPTTDTVLGADSTIAIADDDITLSTGNSGDVQVVTGVSAVSVTPTYKYMSASASGTAVGANGTASAITAITPTTANVVNENASPSIDVVYKSVSTSFNNNNSGPTKDVTWTNKDQKTVLTNTTDVSVTKGTNSGE